jgi:hypothetical protein
VKEKRVSRSSFYALDHARLPVEQQELADTFAELHALAGEPEGPVVKIVVADLMLALEAWQRLDEGQRDGPHAAAIARIIAAIDS